LLPIKRLRLCLVSLNRRGTRRARKVRLVWLEKVADRFRLGRKDRREAGSPLEASGYQTRRVNPLHIRHFSRSAGKLAKTDKIDAEMIAHFGQSLRPPVTLLPDAQTRELQALVTRRQQVVAIEKPSS
jgi:transposase